MAIRSRRQRTNALGRIPLSAGEIELYSREDEMARRRSRLLTMRDEERRLAQQVTQRYRNNLQKLQRWKSLQVQNEAESARTEWTDTRHDGRKGRTVCDARRALKDELAVQSARRRHDKQKNGKSNVASVQHQRKPVARGRTKQNVAQVLAGERSKMDTRGEKKSQDETLVTPSARREGVFAQNGSLIDKSAVVSSFPSDTNDARPSAVADLKHERLGSDVIARGEPQCRSKLEWPEHSDSIDTIGELESGALATSKHDERHSCACGRVLKATASGDVQREENEKSMTLRDMRNLGNDASETPNVPSKPLGTYQDRKLEDKTGTSITNVKHDWSVSGDHGSMKTHRLQRDKLATKDHPVTAPSTEQRQSCSVSVAHRGSIGSEGDNRLDRDMEAKHSERNIAERYGLSSSVALSGDQKKRSQLNTGQLEEHHDCCARSLLELPDAQWNELATRGDRHLSGVQTHRSSVNDGKERLDDMITPKLVETQSASYGLKVSPQKCTVEKGNEKEVRRRMEHSRVCSYKSDDSDGKSYYKMATDAEDGAQRQLSLSSSVSQISLSRLDEVVTGRARFLDQVAMSVEGQLSSSISSSTISQMSLSRLYEVANERTRTLGRCFIDPDMTTFSDSKGVSTDDENSEIESCCPSVGTDSGRSFTAFYSRDPHCRQMHHKARRHSISAASITQYSLPLSETQSSCDESLHRMHLDHPADDSLVNELVPLFPTCMSSSAPHSFDEGSEASEEFAKQLVAVQNNTRPATKRLASVARSIRHVRYQGREAAAADYLRRQASATRARGTAGMCASTVVDERELMQSSGRSSSASSDWDLDAENLNASVGLLRARRNVEARRMKQAVVAKADVRSLLVTGPLRRLERDVMSDISVGSSASSHAVRSESAAVSTWRDTRNDGEEAVDREDSEPDGRQYRQADIALLDEIVDEQSSASEQSYASSSSLSTCARSSYLAATTSAVVGSSPVHLRLRTAICNKKDVTTPIARMTCSATSVSSVSTTGEVDHDECFESNRRADRKSSPSSKLQLTDPGPDERRVHPPHTKKCDRIARKHDMQHASAVNYDSDESDASSVHGRMRKCKAEPVTRLTFAEIEGKISQLPPRLRSMA